MSLIFAFTFTSWWNYVSSASAWNHLGAADHWLRLAKWQGIAQSRWWVFFSLIAVTDYALRWHSNNRQPGQALAKRLLLFAPWICLLEVAFLIGALIQNPATIPEPSTIFTRGGTWDWLRLSPILRGALPSGIALYLFIRLVLRHRPSISLLCAVLLVPLALWITNACGQLYLVLVKAGIV